MESSRPLLRRAAIAMVAALVAIFVALAIAGELDALPDADTSFTPGWLALGALALVAMQLLHAELWRRTLALLGNDLPVVRGWAVWSVSVLARYVPTQLLMVVTRVAMAERDGVPKRVTVASIVYEFGFAVLSSVGVAAWGLIALPELRDSWWRWAVLLAPLAALVVMHPRIFGRVSGVLLHRLGSDSLPRTLSFGAVLVLGTAYAASFLLAGLATVCFVQSLTPVSADDVPVLLTAWAAGYVGALVAFFIPGGLGVRDGLYGTLVARVAPTGVAVTVAAAGRLIHMAIELTFAAVLPILARRMATLQDRESARLPPAPPVRAKGSEGVGSQSRP